MTHKLKGSADEIDVLVGARLREIRSLRGISQEKLGEMLGVTFQQVQKYQCGKNRISASRLYQIAKIFEVPLGYFYEGLEGAQDNDMPAPITKQEASTIRALRALKPDWRNLMARHIANAASVVEGRA
jgi:transcriptional regulator with XRE-family HTH domain